MYLSSKHICALAAFGLAWFFVEYGFFKTVFVLAMIVAGWFIGRVLDGELDISDYVRVHRRDDPEP
ncbi:MAG: DUF2273 domain-containing protein [Armatimonadota bacterium]